MQLLVVLVSHESIGVSRNAYHRYRRPCNQHVSSVMLLRLLYPKLTSTVCSQLWERIVAQSECIWGTMILPGGSGAGT